MRAASSRATRAEGSSGPGPGPLTSRSWHVPCDQGQPFALVVLVTLFAQFAPCYPPGMSEHDGLKLARDDHSITPRKGSMRHAITGEPTLGMRPVLDYPMVAVCRECGRVIRLERYFFADWVHVG